MWREGEDMLAEACESPIEEIFARECCRYISDQADFDYQVEVSTRHERFRVDFVLSLAQETVAVECDGRDFHNPLRDEFRDAVLLGENHFTAVYHFRGCDITFYPADCLWLMSVEYPALFCERGRHQLDYLHELEIVPLLSQREAIILRNPAEPWRRAWVFRRNIRQKLSPNPYWPYWRTLYEFARRHSGFSLDRVISLWKRRFEKEGQT